MARRKTGGTTITASEARQQDFRQRQNAALEARLAAEKTEADLEAGLALKFDKTGGTITGDVVIEQAPGSLILEIKGESTLDFVATRTSNDTAKPSLHLRKARGTIAAPAAVATNDRLGSYQASAYDGADYRVVSEIRPTVIAALPSATDMEGRIFWFLCPPGSATLAEIFRLEHATGLSMFGANIVIDADRGLRLRAQTVAQLGALTPTAGRMFFCSDESGGAVPVFGDGTNWRRVTDRAVVS